MEEVGLRSFFSPFNFYIHLSMKHTLFKQPKNANRVFLITFLTQQATLHDPF